MTENNNQKESLSVEALRAGDRAEFARMVDQFSAPIYRLGMKILGNEQDAEDILQETFIKSFRSIADFEARSSLSTWLYRIATNEALMLLRKRKPTQDLVIQDEGADEDDIEPVEIVDWCCLPEEEMLSTESRTFLEKAVQVLSPSLRLVFLMRDVEGLSIKETADILDLTESAVKVRLMRARLRMREELSHYFGARMDEKKVSDA
jgi:RNA polymerase sigma-70 factor (ECF subfamily)